MRPHRFIWALVASAAIVFIAGAPAYAVMDQNTIGCKGSARIVSKDGKVYTVTSDMEKAVIPREGQVNYDASIATVTHDHFGQVKLTFGLFGITIGDWGPTANSSNKNTAVGVEKLPAALKYALPGSYDVSGFHQGKEGRCSGHMRLEIEGGLTSSPAGIPIVAGTGLAAIGTLAAGLRRRLR